MTLKKWIALCFFYFCSDGCELNKERGLLFFQRNIFPSEDGVSPCENQDDPQNGKDHGNFSPDQEAQNGGEDDAGVAVNGKLACRRIFVRCRHQKLKYGGENAERNQLKQLKGRGNYQFFKKHHGNAAKTADGGIPQNDYLRVIRLPNLFQKGVGNRHKHCGQQRNNIIEVDFMESGTDDKNRSCKAEK